MFTVGDRTYTVPQPLGMKSFALQQRVVPIFMRIASALFGAIKAAPKAFADVDVANLKLEKLLDIDTAAMIPLLSEILPAFGEVFEQMPEGELEAVTRKLLGDATLSIAGGAQNIRLFGAASGGDAFDTLMAGRNIETWALVWEAIKVWYADFFALAVRKRAAETPTPSA